MYLVIVFRDRQKENSDILLNVGIPALFPMSILCFPVAKIGNVFRTGNFFGLKKIKAACVRAVSVGVTCGQGYMSAMVLHKEHCLCMDIISLTLTFGSLCPYAAERRITQALRMKNVLSERADIINYVPTKAVFLM